MTLESLRVIPRHMFNNKNNKSISCIGVIMTSSVIQIFLIKYVNMYTEKYTNTEMKTGQTIIYTLMS